MNDSREMKRVAIAAARSAGTLLMDMALTARATARHKDGNACNFVTTADVAAEQHIIEIIHEHFPSHGVLAEEGGASGAPSEYLWVIDPLDATNNYAHGIPHFAVSIAAYHLGVPLVGVVFDPSRDELFSAEQSHGTTLNGEPVRVSGARTLSECIVVTGFYYDRDDRMRRTLRHIEACFDQGIVGLRRTGCASLDLCYVACGRFGAYWELTLGPWDYAAGALMVMEAGGRVTDSSSGPFNLHMCSMLASNGVVHQQLAEIVAQ